MGDQLTFELAKKLKDVGFPQIWPKPDFLEIKDAMEVDKIYSKYPQEFDPYRPSLSELIEACGDGLHSLRKGSWMGNGVWVASKDQWNKEENVSIPMHPFVGSGSTPEEAVANLWLELNKKDGPTS